MSDNRKKAVLFQSKNRYKILERRTHTILFDGREHKVSKRLYKSMFTERDADYNRWRRKKYNGIKIFSLDLMKESGYDLADKTTTQETDYIERIDLKKAITKLSSLEQTIINLRYGEDLTQKEIAQRFNLPESTLRRYLKVALKKIEKYLTN